MTATPHSGVEENFRSLLGLLDPSFDAPGESRLPRSRLVPHFVQRKRSDLQRWLEVDTPFPERESIERTYQMSTGYHLLYRNILEYCQEYVSHPGGGQPTEAGSLLGGVVDPAVRALQPRRGEGGAREPQAVRDLDCGAERDGASDEDFGRQILDSADEEHPTDYVSTAALDDPEAGLDATDIRELNNFLERAKELDGPEQDAKISAAAAAVSDLLTGATAPSSTAATSNRLLRSQASPEDAGKDPSRPVGEGGYRE